MRSDVSATIRPLLVAARITRRSLPAPLRGWLIASLLWIVGASLSMEALAQDRIRLSQDPSRCWHKMSDGFNNGNIIHIWSCDVGSEANKAFFYDSATGYIRSRVEPSKCLHKQSDGWRKDDVIHLWDCSAGSSANKTFDLHAFTGRVRFRENPSYCARARYLGYDNGNPVVVAPCDKAGTYTLRIANPAVATSPPQTPSSTSKNAIIDERGRPCYMLVKTGSEDGAGATAKYITAVITFSSGHVHRQTLNAWTLSHGNYSSQALDMMYFDKFGSVSTVRLENRGCSGAGDSWKVDFVQFSFSQNGGGDQFDFNTWINTGKAREVSR